MKELQKHLISILLLVLIGLNSFHIAQNSYYIERNAEAILGNVAVINTHSYCMKMLAKELRKIKTGINNNGEQLVNDISIIINTIEQHTKKLEFLYKQTDKLNNKVNFITLKPTYKYLRSVTVFIETKKKDFMDEITEKIIKIAPDLIHLNDNKIQPDGAGTGVIVKIDKEYTYILTNKHVARGLLPDNKEGSKILLMISEVQKNRQRAELVQFHPTEDLALIRIKGKINNKQVINGIAYPNIAEKVYSVGQSLWRPYTYSEGVFSGTILYHDVYELSIMPGCSGSGVFNKYGELLGLVYSFANSNNGIKDICHSNAVKAIYIKQFLQENNILFAK